MSWFDLFRDTDTPIPHNDFGRVSEADIETCVTAALEKVDWAKVGTRVQKYSTQRLCGMELIYGEPFYTAVADCIRAEARATAEEEARKDITADTILTARETSVTKREADLLVAVNELRDLRSLITGVLRDAAFTSLADEVERRLTVANETIRGRFTPVHVEHFELR